ncbi:P-loop containing nucleoside triphosphate hydrolase protein [Amylostereum chailletii]|nr:P-loop containing nucleoside triphosphate hydrolase protein [Amylostereum chailletii]
MPPFLQPASSESTKRKFDASQYDASRKRQAAARGDEPSASNPEVYWMVQWRVPQSRKHKTWDGDGVLVVNGTKATLLDQDGRVLTTGKVGLQLISEGAQLHVGNKELEVDRFVPRTEYQSGACFGRAGAAITPTPSVGTYGSLTKKFVPLKPVVMNPGTNSRPMAAPRKAVELEPVNILSSSAPRTPSSSIPSSIRKDNTESCWSVNWRKPQHKKHKTWDGDAYIILRAERLTLLSESGKILGHKSFEGTRLFSGYKSFIAGREIELDSQMSPSQLPAITGSSLEVENEYDPDLVDISQPSPAQTPSRHRTESVSSPAKNSISSTKKFIAPTTFYGNPPPKQKSKGPLHDPDAEGALVMKAPTEEHASRFNKKNLPVIPVVIDPLLARRLRPHQIEGVRFMYECVMGLRKHEGQGCILADEMGMGKTLQTIALVWTLLKQNPYGAGPAVGKVLIVCPVTLISNWKNEFHKWLGRDRVGIFNGDKDKGTIKQFINSRIHQVLIIGYERLRSVIADLAYCSPPIGLIIADEGHRLKSANNKTSTMFEALRTPRRIILSGTPIQNDLSEFHAMADFCNPGLLDDYSTFRRIYEAPILRSRTPGCSSKDAQLGESRSAQLQAISRSFVLRRDATILKSYLPPKHEYVVFVTPTCLQLAIFTKLLNPDKLDNIIQDSTAESLALINMLTKISNSPILLKAVADKASAKMKQGGNNVARTTAVEEAVKLLPDRAQVEDVSLSGKLTALANLLRAIRKNTDEKCILVSHYTSTLNILEAFCKKKNYSYLRLDGQTATSKRQEFVNTFNKSSQERCFLFLLSSKAGGVGLNLIGASRLCLVDSDWNPSHDLQSMARIHRDGQKREVFIYRFLTAGTIDEKIYQRQVTKLGLSSTLIGNGKSESKSDTFTPKELRDIFTIHPHTVSHTHDLLDCPCERTGEQGGGVDSPLVDTDDSEDKEDAEAKFVVASQVHTGKMRKGDKAYLKKKKAALAALGEWTHINCLQPNAKDRVQDDILRHLIHSPNPDSKIQPAPTHNGSRVLDALDLSNVLNMDEDAGLAIDSVPGGTMSFLFERSSETSNSSDSET